MALHNLAFVLVVVDLVGLIWSIILIRRARDWRARIIAVALGGMPIYQTIAMVLDSSIKIHPVLETLRMSIDLVVNALFLFLLYLLELAISTERRLGVRLRMAEAVNTMAMSRAGGMAVFDRRKTTAMSHPGVQSS